MHLILLIILYQKLKYSYWQDIGSLYRIKQLLLERICKLFQVVLYVPGNHEFYAVIIINLFLMLSLISFSIQLVYPNDVMGYDTLRFCPKSTPDYTSTVDANTTPIKYVEIANGFTQRFKSLLKRLVTKRFIIMYCIELVRIHVVA